MRLKRMGRKKDPYYRIVVIDSRKKRDGKYIDLIGYYNPMVKEGTEFEIDEEKAIRWYRCGAEPTEKVKSLIKKQGIKLNRK